MSYCRWSSNDFQCDVYCYASAGGWETHVAANRLTFAGTLPDPVAWERAAEPEWLERHQKVMAMVDAADHVPIGLPHDGESYTDTSPGAAADRLEWLAAAGYNVPRHAIGDLREEAGETP